MNLSIVRALGLITLQDLGRRGQMHLAVPPGGALVPELLVAANRAAGNEDSTIALEIMGQLVVRAEVDLVVGIAEPPALRSHAHRQANAEVRARVRELKAGAELSVASGNRRCAYLAVRGGIAAPRGTLLCAELGRPLRAGDRLQASGGPIKTGTSSVASQPIEPFDERDTVTVLPGPDLDAFGDDALQRLVAAPYRILPTSDRVGTRLQGEALPRAASYRERSRPMVIGALEVPGDGQPIVLGPEHPTTGGYPIVAVIATAELGRFFAIRLGGTVRFVVR